MLDETRTLIDSSRLSDRIVELPDPSDTDLAALYSSAALLLFPSLAEGFGWPVLEAMACGCRVVAANRAPLTEIAAGAATYIDVEDAKGAAAVVAKVLAESNRDRETRLAAGRSRAGRFRRDAMIDDYVRVYRDLLAGVALAAADIDARAVPLPGVKRIDAQGGRRAGRTARLI
jgi:glycosyltransferase involved in cell wall biosynthesis